MNCPLCASSDQMEFPAEVLVHLPGLVNADKLPICMFPKLLVCLDCGGASFETPTDSLAELRAGVKWRGKKSP